MGCTPDRIRRVRTFFGVDVLDVGSVADATSADSERERRAIDVVGRKENDAMDFAVSESVYIRR